MPKRAKELSALQVQKLRHRGHGGNWNVAVGGVPGFQLEFTPTQARSWLLRIMVGGRRRNIGLGSYPTVSLADARETAREYHGMVHRGQDPVEEKRKLRADLTQQARQSFTFRDAMEQFLERKLQEFGNPKHRKQWRSSLDQYAVPVLGSLPVCDIDVQDVQRTLLPIWGDKTETASRFRGRIEAVLAWATVNGYRSGDNPARWRGNLDATLPKPGKIAKVTHLAALDLKDAAKWYGDLRSRNGTATRALEFLALTAARSGEVRGARVDEFDTQTGVWIIPASRMKAGKEHRVPLGDRAKEIVSAAIEATHSDFLFPATSGGMLSDMALSACMRRIHDATEHGYVDRRSNRPAVPHGLRSTFRDWAAEKTDYPRDMAEIALAHSVGSEVERAYRRGDMLEKRLQMMAEWESFLTFGCPKEK